MQWLDNFLDKKFKLKRVPPFLWPFLVPLLVGYAVYISIAFIIAILIALIMWISGFKSCHYCGQWRWANTEMIVKRENVKLPSGRYKTDEHGDYVYEEHLKCVACEVADKLTED